MPSPTERNTKRRKRVAAAFGILLVVAGGLAYASTRDDAPGTNEPSDIAAAPPATNSDTPSGAATDTSSPATDGTDTTGTTNTTTTSAKKKVTTTTTVTTGTTQVIGVDVDIDIDTASRRPPDPGTEPNPATFSVSGSPSGTFQPNVSRAVDLTITNPNGSDLTVTGITVAVGPSSVPACGAGNIVVTRQFSGTIVVPAGATRSLSALGVPEAQWPVVTMPETGVDQDACQQATFQLTYTGTGTVA